jgi:hypothetical protein
MFDQVIGTSSVNEDLKSLYAKIKPLINEASPEQKEKFFKLLESAKKKFEASKTVENVSESADYLPEK